MINDERIVQITNLDLLTLYGTVLKIAGETISKLEASDPAEFSVTADGDYIANEPLKNLDFASTATSGNVYFVAAYDYKGFKIAGSDVVTTGDTVEADGRTLYKATLASGAVAIEKIGF